MSQPEDDFQAENDMYIIQSAKQIEQNPSRIAKAKAVAARKAQQLMEFANDGVDQSERETLGRGFRKL